MALQLQSRARQVYSYHNTVAHVLLGAASIGDVWWVQRNLSFIRLLSAMLWEERDNRRISSTARNLSEIEQSTVEHNTYHIMRSCAWELLSGHLEVAIPPVAVLLNCPPFPSFQQTCGPQTVNLVFDYYFIYPSC